MNNLQAINILRSPLSYFDWWENLKDMELEVKKEWLLRVHALRNQTEGTRDSKPMVIFFNIEWVLVSKLQIFMPSPAFKI